MDKLGSIFSGLGGAGGGSSSPMLESPLVHDFGAHTTMVLDADRSLQASSGDSDVCRIEEITKFSSATASSSSQFRPGCAFVSTGEVLAYSLKEGTLRLIHRPSGSRALLKAHSAAITDMCFPDSTTLFTCAEDGQVVAWSIALTQKAGDEDDNEPQYEIQGIETLRIQCPAGAGASPRRVVTHPLHAHTLLIAHGSDVTGVVLTKACWEAYSALPNKLAGLPLERVARFRLQPQAHRAPINDVSFTADGQLIVTASEDETVLVWALTGAALAQGQGEIRPLNRIVLGQPVSFARLFAGNSLLVAGFTQSDSLVIVSARPQQHQQLQQPQQVLAVARFAASASNKQQRVSLRAQLIKEQFVVLCDANNAFLVVVEIDDHHYFRRAVSIALPQCVTSFSLSTRSGGGGKQDGGGGDQDAAAELNAIGDTLFHSIHLGSLHDCFRAQPGQLPPARVAQHQHQAPPPPPPPLPPAVILHQQQQMQQAVLGGAGGAFLPPLPQRATSSPGLPPPSSSRRSSSSSPTPLSPPPPPPQFGSSSSSSSVMTGSGAGVVPLELVDRLLQDKLDALVQRLDEQARDQQHKERERTNRLLEAFSLALRDVPSKVGDAVAAQFASPSFQDAVASIVQQKLNEAGGAAGGAATSSTNAANLNNKALDRSLRAVLPSVLDKFTEQISSQVASKLGMSRAFEDAMASKLVPAFEAGVRDMMAQFEDYYAQAGQNAAVAAAAAAAAAAAVPGSPYAAAGGGVGDAASLAFRQPGTPEKRLQVEQQIAHALNRGNVIEALRIALPANGEFPTLLVETCDKVSLSSLLLNEDHGLPQLLLVQLLDALALQNLHIESLRRFEWIEALSLAVDPGADEIASMLPRVATEVREALVRDSDLFHGCPHYRTVLRLLLSLSRQQ